MQFHEELAMIKERDHIFPMVCSAERNGDYLLGMPHTVVEDMAVLYYVAGGKAAEGGEEAAVMPVTAELLEKYGMDIEELHAAAVKNIGNMGNIAFRNMCDVYKEAVTELFGPETGVEEIEAAFPEKAKRQYTIGLKSGEYGAAVILNDDVRRMAAGTVGEEYYILPSSVNEVIVLPKEEDTAPEELAEIVRNMNCGQQPDLVLTDSVYEYNAGTRIFRRAAGPAEETVF